MGKKDKASKTEAKPDKALKKQEKAQRKAEKKAKKKAKALAPREVKTGKGATPAEVGAQLVEMFNKGQFAEIEEMFWSPKVTSVEGVGVSLAWEGRDAVRSKNDEWMKTHTIHSASAEGPFVGASGFAVKFRMDVEDSTSGKRSTMHEVGVYTIKNGKIVREEFMYGS